MIKAYIFDFGNVLARFYPEELSAPYAENAEALRLISERVFSREIWDRIDDGTLDDDEVRAKICESLPSDLHPAALSAYDNWIKNLTPVKGMPKLISDIRTKTDKRLYLLSNIGKGFARGYGEVEWIRDLLGNFDGLVLTGTIGIVKPTREVFSYLTEKYGILPEECLFIDDNEKNIIGAEGFGIKGYLFDGDAEKLRIYLENFE